jgi:hypothetical protein
VLSCERQAPVALGDHHRDRRAHYYDSSDGQRNSPGRHERRARQARARPDPTPRGGADELVERGGRLVLRHRAVALRDFHLIDGELFQLAVVGSSSAHR